MKPKYKIPVAKPALIGNEKKYVNDCLRSGWISSTGEYVDLFEEKFATFCNVKYAVACANGTVALHLALLAHGVRPGDEVIAPTLTFIATANAVTYCGARPVFIDSELTTWNIDPKLIESRITKKTKGIIIVHLYGHPVDMDNVNRIAKKYKLFVIEDAAEAHGALHKDQIVGSLGHSATFSFYGNKLITTGEGGMVVTNDRKIADKARLLKGQGMDPQRRYWFSEIGYNYRMTNIQAAIGLAQLENIEIHLQKRFDIASKYSDRLKRLRKYVKLPVQKKWAKHSYWMYSILLKDAVQVTRDQFMKQLHDRGIETRPVFYPMHQLPPYKEARHKYPVADYIASRGINLPTFADLKDNEINYITDTINELCTKQR